MQFIRTLIRSLTFGRVFPLALSVWLLSGSALAYDTDLFPSDSEMRIRIAFWKKIYTEIPSTQALIHDEDDLRIIYKKIDYPNTTWRQRRSIVRRERNQLRKILFNIARKEGEDLTSDEKSVYEKVAHLDWKQIRKRAYAIRRQQGMADQFHKGLERSYMYLDRIREVFERMGLPKELAFLPHVESSFDYKAYSKVGAAGIWQFMRSTGRIYQLKINYVIDERRDPMAATVAAASLLRDNYSRIESWPLAITAYNHGIVSMERAASKVGTKDMSEIIRHYNGRRFGFASKNFYASFLAALEIAESPTDYFNDFRKLEPASLSELTLHKPLTIDQISSTLGIQKDIIRQHNLSIRPIGYRMPLYLPKGFKIRIPKIDSSLLASLEEKMKNAKGGSDDLKAGGHHIVSRGESLYEIAQIYRTSISNLIVLNQISRPSRLMPGTRLKIPTSENSAEILAARKGKSRSSSSQVAKNEASEKEKSQAGDEPKAVVAVAGEEPKSTITTIPSLLASNTQELEDFPTTSSPKLVYGPPLPPSFLPTGRKIATTSLEHYDLDIEPYRKGTFQITVETDETIGHYADWSGVPLTRIRRANRLWGRRTIHQGQKLRLPLTSEQLSKFNAARIEYHLAIQEDFFNSYRLTEMVEYKVKRGDTIAEITRTEEIPLWLLRRYQPDLKLVAGQTIQIPEVVQTTE